MSTFGSKIKIDRYIHSRVKYCQSGGLFAPTQGLVTTWARSNNNIKVWDYKNFDHTPVTDTDLLTPNIRPQSVLKTKENKFFIVAIDDNNDGTSNERDQTIYYCDENLNVLASAFINIPQFGGFLDWAFDEQNQVLYVSNGRGFNNRQVHKFDIDLNQIWITSSGALDNVWKLTLTRSGVLVIADAVGEKLHKINTDTGAISKTVDLADINEMNRAMNLCGVSEGNIAVVRAYGGSGTNAGGIEIWDDDLNFVRRISASGEFGVAGGTGQQYIEPYIGNVVYITDTRTQNTYKINITTGQRVWSFNNRQLTGSLFDTGRPNTLSVDFDGNAIVGLGIGNDSRAFNVISPDGAAIFSQGVPADGTTIHYDGWFRLYDE